MKKTLLKSLAVVAFAMIAGYNVYQSDSKTEGMSELMLANVEALASGEIGSISDCNHYCIVKPGYTCIVTFSGDVEFITCPGYGKP